MGHAGGQSPPVKGLCVMLANGLAALQHTAPHLPDCARRALQCGSHGAIGAHFPMRDGRAHLRVAWHGSAVGDDDCFVWISLAALLDFKGLWRVHTCYAQCDRWCSMLHVQLRKTIELALKKRCKVCSKSYPISVVYGGPDLIQPLLIRSRKPFILCKCCLDLVLAQFTLVAPAN